MRTIDYFHNYSRRQEVENLSTPDDIVLGVYNPETNSYESPREDTHDDLPVAPGTVVVGELADTPVVDDFHNYRRRQ